MTMPALPPEGSATWYPHYKGMDQSIRLLQATPPGSAKVNEPGLVYFDEFFASGGGGNPTGPGATDAEKVAAMNLWNKNNSGAGARPGILFNTRTYDMPSIQMWSGMSLIGGRSTAVREYTTGTKFNCTSTNQMDLTGVSNGGYGYPSGGACRDINIHNILFNGGATKNWMEPVTAYTAAWQVIWMSTFHNCGWTNWKTILNGYIDGVTISGNTHVQGCYDTPFTLGGSENNIFGDGFAFMDSAADVAAGTGYPIVAANKPFIKSHMDKSRIGRIMVTTRQTGTALEIDGGSNQLIDGFCADAQSGDPTYGSAVRVTGGTGTVFSNCSFKGMMGTPASAPGNNRGWVDISGGDQIAFTGCMWTRQGSTLAALTTPIVYVGTGVTGVKFGANTLDGWGTSKGILREAVAGGFSYVAGDSTIQKNTG